MARGKTRGPKIDLEKTSIDEIVLYKLPIPLQYTFLWKVLHSDCCCCCGMHGVSTPTQGTVDSKSQVNVDFQIDGIKTYIVGGSIAGPELHCTWSVTGLSGLKVDIQVKSNFHYPNWYTLLADQPPSDSAYATFLARTGETFSFRALAKDPQGNTYPSRIISVP